MKNEKLNSYANDLLLINKHVLKVVRNQKTSEKVRDIKAVNLLQNIDVSLTNQINRFEEFESLEFEGTIDNIKERMATITGSIAGTIDKLREDPVSKMMRDNYTALSMIASGYTMLHAAATVAGRDELKEFAAESLATTAQLITETSQVIPFIVAEELTDDAQAKQSFGEQSMKETQKAWKPEAIFEES